MIIIHTTNCRKIINNNLLQKKMLFIAYYNYEVLDFRF